ncbi:hypothetical protein BJY01DRAFT_156357 [Aspergillus pseudoustus]|uniref:Proteophosphoglycan 5 n=1 Tax=Aspergillus pseudoustus TaxID=1810923 RepID=A0ABR4KAW7_9EURO
MSTPSQTPLTPKGPRNNRRNQKRITTPSHQNAATLATPPSSPPRTESPRGAGTDSSSTNPLSKKKGNRSSKKPRDVPKTSPVNKPNHRHTSSHPNNNTTISSLKDTHYAGPTFHASPAPSTLPIPSFISKSFPESDLAPTSEHDSDGFDADADFESTPSKPKLRPSLSQDERQSTPLDFLFKAAVDARNRPSQQSPEPSPRVRSPQTDSKAIQQRKYNSDTSGMFPLEMGASDLRHSQIGPSFAPSYKDRMNALRSASSPSPNLQDLDEGERKAKTEALKTLLLNPRPQRPSSVFHSSYNQEHPSHERPGSNPMGPHFATPLRTSSGPPTITSRGDFPGKQLPHSECVSLPGPHHTHFNPPLHRPYYDSTLGRGVLISNSGNTSSTPRQAYGSPSAPYSYGKFPPNQQSPVHYPQFHSQSPAPQNAPANDNLPALDTKKIEDDLRRILKLDVNPSIPTSGIQSSLA